ncbi:MAG: putative sensor protein [Pedosphaera sp.]|nr:putative sensor protein [Pedosphaera sp.]
MNQPLRVLVVEDSENDADLMLWELRRGGYETKPHRVDTAEAMEAALDRQQWDIIISDYVMPCFSGLDALKVFKKRGLDIPFIILSGHIGEDIAVAAMKAGADDYIMKNTMARLVPAVARELREAGIRQARRESDRALRESEERFRQLAENIDVAFFMFNRSGGEAPNQILYVSSAYESIWGLSRESLQADPRSWLEAVHPEDRKKILVCLPDMERGEFDQEFRIITTDREMRWIHYRTFPVINETGDIYRVAGIAENITKRKEAEEQLEANARELALMVRELKCIDEQLRARNREISQAREELEKRVHERTIDLTVANAELQCQINERTRLERELLEIAEKERRRIGFDLHDDLSQKLMGISFMIKALETKVSKKQVPKLAETQQIQELINQVINHTHNLAHNFSTLDSQGGDLALELKELAANVKKMFKISCQLNSADPLPALQQNVTVQLYKIAQEAASNAIKHGRASHVSISLSCQQDKLVLSITNDGVPFPENRNSTDRMGLRIMNSRASMIGGALEIRANGTEGTVVTCTLPLCTDSKIAKIDFSPKPNGNGVSHVNGRQLAPAGVWDETAET